jgi:enhancing lycopene biosynthesis protein 2
LGGYDPSGDAHIGFGVRGGNGGGFNLNIFASKGSSRSLNSVTPSVVTQNGVPGTIFSGTQRPFVTGFIPVVGSSAPVSYVSPIDVALQRMKQQGQTLNSMRAQIIDEQRQIKAARQQQVVRTASTEKSSATSGALSLDEIRRLKAERKSAISEEIAELVKQVDSAEAEGHFGSARTLLNQAIRKSEGQVKVDLQKRYATLRNKR